MITFVKLSFLIVLISSCKSMESSSPKEATALEKLFKGTERFYEKDAIASKYDRFYQGCEGKSGAGYCRATVYTFEPAHYDPVNDTKRNTAVSVDLVAIPAMYKRPDGRWHMRRHVRCINARPWLKNT